MWNPSGLRAPAFDEGIPVAESKLAWTLAIAACAVSAWLTPWMIPLPPWIDPRPWWSGGKTPLSMALGATLLIPGALLGLASVRALGAGRELVTRGPYRFVRHPYYLAILVLLVGVIVALRSLPAVVLLVPAVRLTVGRARREEHNLRLAFGERHERYCARVPFLLPLAPPLPPGGLDAEGEGDVRLHLDDDVDDPRQNDDSERHPGT